MKESSSSSTHCETYTIQYNTKFAKRHVAVASEALLAIFTHQLRVDVYLIYRAMLCIRGTSHGPVSVRLSMSVCPSQVGVLLKLLNV